MKKLLTTLIFFVLLGGYAMAYDFSAVCSTGQTLFYNITSDTDPYTVEVTIENTEDYYTTFPDGDLEIPETVEYNNITYSVTSIGERAFYFCSGLTSVIIAESIENIGNYAFASCSNLSSVTIPNSVTSIGKCIFSGCSELAEPIYNNNIFAYFPCGYATQYAIPDGIQIIAGEAFVDCSEISEITISESVTNIGNGAFSGCSNLTTFNFNATNCTNMSNIFNAYGRNPLTTLNIGENVINIPESAFPNCFGLTSVNIPNSVVSIGISAFEMYQISDTSLLSSVTIGNSVTSIGSYAFSGCPNIAEVIYTGDIEQWCGITFGNESANPLYYSQNLYINDSILTNLVIPETITEIKPYTFYNAAYLTSVTIPSSVTNISKLAFHNCTNLQTIAIDSDNTVYDSREDCNAIVETETNRIILGCANTVIPSTITQIGDSAFYGSSIRILTIPEQIDSIGRCAFAFCRHLTTVNLNANNCTYMSPIDPYSAMDHYMQAAFCGCDSLIYLNIGENVMNIPDYAFENCWGLTSLVIPDAVVIIGNNAFYNCSSLDSVVVGNSVTTIKGASFVYCNRLKKLVIGSSVDSIGNYSFYGCDSLNDIFVKAIEPPVLGEDVFVGESNDITANAHIMVPCGTADSYRNDSEWGSFRDIRSDDPSISIDTTVNNSITIGDYTFYSTGNYTFTLPSEVGCDTIIDLQLRVLAEPIYDIGPNPAKNLLNINSDGFVSVVEFYSATGQLVMRKEVNAYEAEFNVEGLADGVYILKIWGEESCLPSVYKIVKE